MNPETNQFEKLKEDDSEIRKRLLGLEKEITLIRPNGEPVPKHWSVFAIDELVEIKNYTFKVVYINESSITFGPVGPVIIEHKDKE